MAAAESFTCRGYHWDYILSLQYCDLLPDRWRSPGQVESAATLVRKTLKEVTHQREGSEKEGVFFFFLPNLDDLFSQPQVVEGETSRPNGTRQQGTEQ